MPYNETTACVVDLIGASDGNQAQPLLLSNRGRYVWSDKPFRFDFERGILRIRKTTGPIHHGLSGRTLRDAFHGAAQRFFPADGRKKSTSSGPNRVCRKRNSSEESETQSVISRLEDADYDHSLAMLNRIAASETAGRKSVSCHGNRGSAVLNRPLGFCPCDAASPVKFPRCTPRRPGEGAAIPGLYSTPSAA